MSSSVAKPGKLPNMESEFWGIKGMRRHESCQSRKVANHCDPISKTISNFPLTSKISPCSMTYGFDSALGFVGRFKVGSGVFAGGGNLFWKPGMSLRAFEMASIGPSENLWELFEPVRVRLAWLAGIWGLRFWYSIGIFPGRAVS